MKSGKNEISVFEFLLFLLSSLLMLLATLVILFAHIFIVALNQQPVSYSEIRPVQQVGK